MSINCDALVDTLRKALALGLYGTVRGDSGAIEEAVRAGRMAAEEIAEIISGQHRVLATTDRRGVKHRVFDTYEKNPGDPLHDQRCTRPPRTEEPPLRHMDAIVPALLPVVGAALRRRALEDGGTHMTTDPTATTTALSIGSALQEIPVPNAESTRFAILRTLAIPEFGFLIREDAEPRYGWEAWLTIRNAQMDALSAIAERSAPPRRVRIASNAGELDALLLATAAPVIDMTCRQTGVAALFVQHACAGTFRDALALPNVRVVDLDDYPLALLTRYGTEVIADALVWINFDARWRDQYNCERVPFHPRPITVDDIRFLKCHTAHLERDLEIVRRFRR